MNDSPSFLDELQAQVNRRAERLSDIEKEQLKAVTAAYKQSLSAVERRERQQPVSVSVLLQASPYRPSDRLTEVVAILDEWLAQPKVDSLVDPLIDYICGE